MKECGFTVAQAECGAPYFEEAGAGAGVQKARTAQDMDPQPIFLDGRAGQELYPEKDYHTHVYRRDCGGAEGNKGLQRPGCGLTGAGRSRYGRNYDREQHGREKPGGAGGPERPLPWPPEENADDSLHGGALRPAGDGGGRVRGRRAPVQGRPRSPYLHRGGQGG